MQAKTKTVDENENASGEVKLLNGRRFALLADLIDQIEVNRNYQKSDLLQVIRILKNYDFFKEPQLELFKAKRKRRKMVES